MSTFCADGLIPARFLCLIAHFIMLVMALNHRVCNKFKYNYYYE